MTSANSTPVFGRRTAAARRVDFILLSYNGREEETEHPFTARAVIDASTALQANSSDPAVAARAIQNLLIRVLVDDDGIPRDAFPRPAGAPADDAADDVDDDDDPGADVAVYGGNLATEEWLIGDEEKTFPSRDLALAHAKENGSSLRRFIDLMDNPLESVELTALRGLVKLLSKEGGARPTRSSGGSSRPRTTKRRR